MLVLSVTEINAELKYPKLFQIQSNLKNCNEEDKQL